MRKISGNYREKCPYYGGSFCNEDCFPGAIALTQNEQFRERIRQHDIRSGGDGSAVCLTIYQARIEWDNEDPRSVAANARRGDFGARVGKGPSGRRKR